MRKSIRDAILAEVNAAKDINETVTREEREMSDVEYEKVTGHLEKAAGLKASGEREDDLNRRQKDLSAGLGLGGEDGESGPPAGEPAPVGRNRSKTRLSLGEQFVKSAEYAALLNAVPNQRFSEKSRVQSTPMVAAGGIKALMTSSDHDASAGFLVEEDRRGLLDPYYQRPLTIRDLVASGSTNSDTIEYVRMSSTTNNASVVAEATTADPVDGTIITPAMGGVKPQSTFEFDRDSTSVRTIAHWLPITKRALADAGQIRTIIDSFLRYGLEEELEDEMVTGDGTGEHFLGLNNTPGIQTQAAPGAGQNNLDVLRIAKRKVRIGGRAAASAYLMNPVDWEKVELARNGAGDYYGGGPFTVTSPRLWGLPVVESEVIAPGTAWCAAWNYAVLYDREQATVQATDAHADFFVRNLVAILAELRAGFAVLRPPAFCKTTLT